MNGRRLTELFAGLLVGDGVLALIRPRRHSRLWQANAPKPYADMMDSLAEKPELARCVAAAQIALGLFLAFSQHADD